MGLEAGLDKAELEQFAREGYAVKAQVFGAEDLAPIRAAMDEIVERAATDLHGEGRLSDTCAGEPFERRLAQIYLRDEVAGREVYSRILGRGGGGYNGPAMLGMLRHPPLLACIESLVGPDIIGSSVYRIRPKMPKWLHGEVPWHQDSGYLLSHCDQELIVTCWIPLVDATLANGCLYVLPQAHRQGVVCHYTGGHAGFLEIAPDDLPPSQPVPVEMKAGDVLFLTNLTPHASFENTTDQVRWSVDLRFQGAEAPNNVDEDPASYKPEREKVTMACYPPEADFVLKDTQDPGREVRKPEEFHRIRARYDEVRPSSPGRGWTPLAERE
jgi:phytanoyl-CoA hydroxylase